MDDPKSLPSLPKVQRLSEEERYQLLVAWNDTQKPAPLFGQSIQQLVEKQAKNAPEAVAIVGQDGRRLCYRDLNARANQVAHFLRKQGVHAETLVGVYMERSPEMIIGVLGILKAGGAYVPLDPAYPKERLTFLLFDAQVSLILTQTSLVDQLSTYPGVFLCIGEEEQIKLESQENLDDETIPGQLAYVMYTSGSTGQPKGVQIEQRSLLNLIFWHLQTFAVSAQDHVTHLAGLGFDASVWEVWPYLVAGACIHLVSEERRLSPELLQEWLLAQGISICFLPTPLVERVLSLPWPATSALRIILTGGEKLRRFPGSLLPFQLVNNYGPTENTVVTTSGIVLPQEQSRGAPSIGRPISNIQLYILDPSMQPVPVGVAGELYLGGKGLARGYLHQPASTAERFVPHPFSAEIGARLYGTGDLVRYLADGTIEFLGRSDRQIKIRGQRIELGEIEEVLSQHPVIRECIVVARENGASITEEKYLVAYVVLYPGESLVVREVRDALKRFLPDSMIPSAFVVLDVLPLTANGKFDFAALPLPELAKATAFPRTLFEDVVAGICADILGQDLVSIDKNFFESGGHSLLATQVIARIQQIFQVIVPLRMLFERTIADIAKFIELNRSGNLGAQIPSLRPFPSRHPVPLSFQQEIVWFLVQLNPAILSYHFACIFQFTGKLNKEVLERSLFEIIQRHAIFRTTFLANADQPLQIVHLEGYLELPVIDLRGLPIQERNLLAQDIIRQAGQKPFDVTKLPLIRWVLLLLDTHESLLFHMEQHLVHDGWSFNVFLHELRDLYTAFSQGNSSPLPALPVQFADFVHWQRAWMQGEVLQRQQAYWQRKLADAPSLLFLPLDRPRPAVQRFRGSALRLELANDICRVLREVCHQEGVTLFMVMVAAFLALLYRSTGQEDLCVGTGVANRRMQETEALIGMFVNTVVLRTSLSGDPSLRELLSRVREVILEAQEYQDLPFDKVVEVLQLERSLSHNMLFQTMFNFHDAPLIDFELPDLSTHIVEGINNGSAKFDLNIITIPRFEQHSGHQHAGTQSDGMTMIWEYNTDIFDRSTIERMAGHYQRLLQSFIADLSLSIKRVPLLSAAELHTLLVEWSSTQNEFSLTQCIHQAFEAQVERTPEAVALLFEDTAYTYQELNRRANQLAHYLHTLQVGPEECVGLCIERSGELIVGLLGILKAGAAYVPLDPQYPHKRISWMLIDANISVVVTQERFRSLFQAQISSLVVFDTDWPRIAQEPSENLFYGTCAQNLAYVMYTSGSTGNPKGVSVVHQNVMRLVKETTYVAFTSSDVFLQFAPLTFDASTFEIWGCLLNGARLVIYPDSRASVEALGQVIEKYQVSTLWLTAGLFHQMVDQSVETLRNVTQLLAGGDVLSPSHVQKMLQEVQTCQLINGYGPTENTTFTCCYSLPSSLSEQAFLSIPIGRPIANTQVYLLDELLQPVPIGVAGELYTGGAGLARGYLHNPAMTAEKFLPNPFDETGGSRLYRTGDRARYLQDGQIEFLGRLDNQVKLRGYRIELGEIEAALANHPSIRESIVCSFIQPSGDKLAVGYVVLEQGVDVTSRELRHFLQARLPDYMVPSIILFLASLPLTANGKVDRRALPLPEKGRMHLTNEYAAPSTPLEKAVADIWEEVLGLERMGIYDNFFEMGGHSLLATRIVTRLRKSLRVNLPLQSIFEAPTVAGLSRIIAQYQQQSKSVSEKTPLLVSALDTDQVLDTIDQLPDEVVKHLLNAMYDQNENLHPER